MQSARNPSTAVAEAAAFALYEAFRRAQGLALSPDERFRLTYLRTLDAAAAGLAWAEAGVDALQLRWGDVPTGFAGSMWVHATAPEAGPPSLALSIQRERPMLEIRLAGPAFVPTDDGRLLLRERPTFSSHDGHQGARERLLASLASAWRVPREGPWLLAGHWDPREGAWEPGTPARLGAIALLVEATRRLDPAWLGA